MKNFRLSAGLLGVLGLALLSGCATLPRTRRVSRPAPPVTYALMVTDAKGMLSPADFHKVEVGVIQYLLDEGYVRAGEKYVTDVMHADIVFRVRIAWQGTQGGFKVVEVVPSYSAPPPPPGGYAGGGSAHYAPGYAGAGWYGGPWWNNDPWWYDDYYGFGPYDAFGGFYPFVPIYAWNLHRHDRGDHDGHRDRDPRHHDRSPDGDGHPGPAWWHHRGGPDSGPPAARWDGHDRDHNRHAGAPAVSRHPPHSRDWARVPTRRRPLPVSGYRQERDHGRPPPWLRRNPEASRPAAVRAYSPPRRSYSPPPRTYTPPVRAHVAPAARPAPPPPPPAAPAARAGDRDSHSRSQQR